MLHFVTQPNFLTLVQSNCYPEQERKRGKDRVGRRRGRLQTKGKKKRKDVKEREGEKVFTILNEFMQDQGFFNISYGFICIQQEFKKCSIIVDLTFIRLSSVRSDDMLFCSLFHIITAWYLIESDPYDLLLASSTNAKLLEAEHVEWLCCSVVFLQKFNRGWGSCFFTSKAFCNEVQSKSFRIFGVL